MSISLSRGAIAELMSGRVVQRPILQLKGTKRISSNETERFRLLMSDGTHTAPSFMLATQLNHIMTNEEIGVNSIICLEKLVCNRIPGNGNKCVVIVLEVTVLDKDPIEGAIGNPIPFDPTAPAVVADEPPVQTPAISSVQRQVAPTQAAQNSNFMNRNSFSPNAAPFASRPSTSMTESQFAGKIFPIASLTPYQNRWAICGRLTSKNAIKTYNNARGEGRLFSMTFADRSGEIRATAFNTECDKFFDLLQLDKVYYVGSGQVKNANRQYSSVPHDYEITFQRDTVVEISNDADANDTPQIQFNFIPIADLQAVPKNTAVDVLGVCKSVGDCQTFISKKTNREIRKRDVQLVDKSNAEVTLTLWGEDAENFDGSSNPVIALRGVSVSDFGGCSLSLSNSSTMQINPNMRDGFLLKTWFEKEAPSAQIQSLSKAGGGAFTNDWKCLAQVEMDNLGGGDKPDFFMCKATVIMIKKENILYKACASENCNKKVQENNGFYRCEKCNTEVAEFKWRLLLNMNLADYSGSLWVTCFQETAEVILGKSAQEMGALMESSDEELQAAIQAATFSSFTLKLRTKMESYNDETRIKTIAVSVTPINHGEYGMKVLESLNAPEK